MDSEEQRVVNGAKDIRMLKSTKLERKEGHLNLSPAITAFSCLFLISIIMTVIHFFQEKKKQHTHKTVMRILYNLIKVFLF